MTFVLGLARIAFRLGRVDERIRDLSRRMARMEKKLDRSGQRDRPPWESWKLSRVPLASPIGMSHTCM